MITAVLTAFAMIDQGLIWRSVVLLIGVAWIIGGCHSVLHPDRVLERTRRSATKHALALFEAFKLMSPGPMKALGYIVLGIGFIVVLADLYLFAHPELMR